MSIAKRVLGVLGGLLALAAAAGVGWYVASLRADDSSTTTASADSALTSTESTDPAGATTQPADTEAADAETTTVSTDSEAEASTSSTASTTQDGPVDDGRPEGYEGDAPFAIFENNILTLYGKVPDQDTYDRYQERFGSIVGPDNVVNKYTIDPAFAISEGQKTPVYVTDAVLFDFNSVAIDPAYVYLLDYGALMLQQNPQATLTIVTRTDAVGSEAVNLEVARLRAQAVLDYWAKEGVDPAQVKADPRGEEGATEDADEATAARQRRAEFIITGLLD